MLRLIFVTALLGVGTVWSFMSITGAGCFLLWADIFRPTRFARYAAWLHYDRFPTYDFVYAVFFLSVVITRWRKRWTATTTITLAFLAWVWICTLAARDVSLAMTKAVEATKYILPLIVLSMALNTRRSQQFVLYTLALSVGIWLAHYGMITVFRGSPMTVMSIPSGQMSDRNDFLVAGTACLPLLVYMGWWFEGPYRRWVRIAFRCMAGLSIVPFFTSESRGAVIGLGGLVVFFALGLGRLRPRIAAAAAAVTVAVIVFMPGYTWERLSTIEVSLDPADQVEKSARNRLIHMQTAIKVSLDHPVFGVGPRNYPQVAPLYGDHFKAEPHCIWLKASAEYGITMLLFFATVVISFIVRLRRISIRARDAGDAPTAAMSAAIACALFGFLAAGSFTSQFMSEYLWAIVTLAGTFLATESARGITPVAGSGSAGRVETPVAAGV